MRQKRFHVSRARTGSASQGKPSPCEATRPQCLAERTGDLLPFLPRAGELLAVAWRGCSGLTLACRRTCGCPAPSHASGAGVGWVYGAVAAAHRKQESSRAHATLATFTEYPWDREPNEGPQAFEAFAIYRDMGYQPRRTNTWSAAHGCEHGEQVRGVAVTELVDYTK
jgi:hypothetical protein